jgi:transposase
MPIPVQMRRRMLAAVERGEPIAQVARRFEVSERGLHKLIRRCRERGTLEPGKPGPKAPTKLTPADDATMLAMVRADPGVTLNAIRAKLGVSVAESTVCRRLRRLGLSFKKSP